MISLLKLAIVIFGAGFGAYLGSYLKRKGENLATHEDIDNLVQQVSAVTKATKEIEARISDDVWDRQKRWELRREVLFETTKRIASVRAALFTMSVVYSLRRNEGEDKDEPIKSHMVETENEASGKVLEAGRDFEQARFLAELVCGKEVTSLLISYNEFTLRIAKEISKRESENVFIHRNKELLTREDAIKAAMRKEIGVDEAHS
jgi:hypothetical protein